MRVRDVTWRAGAPARSTLILSIRLYRAVLSGWLGGQCRFSPTCSHYAEQAIREFGAVRGVGLAAWRVARCNPYGQGGIDPVSSTAHRVEYDAVLRPPREART
ncbi:MAG: membrane protein insertion efficiency factor YidD [Actinomycetota bacterium]